MEGLGKFLDSLSQSLSQEEDCAVGDEFCALVVGIGYLREAIKESEKEKDKGESEAGKEEKKKEYDIVAMAERMEYDLARFIG